MIETVLETLIALVWAMFGGWFIKQSIINLKKEHYMLFGMNIMFAIWTAERLIKYGALL